MVKDVYGEALLAYYKNPEAAQKPLLLHSSYGDTEEMPVEVFFREEEDFTELEYIALSLTDGKVLDVGAGAGCHSLYLQDKKVDVEAIELSAIACTIMQQRGVKHILEQDFFNLTDKKYDTLLFLMNGIGLTGTIDGFRELLTFAKTLLTDRGQLLFDSSDISYLYDEYEVPRPAHYFGEISYHYAYNEEQGAPFRWLYIDQKKLIEIAHEMDWVVQVLFEDENDQYLVRMEPKKKEN